MEELKVIAMVECSDGNESVGSMWVEARQFEPTDNLHDVLYWASKVRSGIGRIMIRYETP